LDVDSTGLVLLSDDGDFVQRVTHPKYEVEKEYWMEVKGPLDDALMDKAKMGILDEGESLRIDAYKIVHSGPVKSRAMVVLHQGRKREVRRIFKSLERFVVKLKRVRIGNIELGDVEEGKVKELRDFDPATFLKGRKKSRRSDFVKERKKQKREKKVARQVEKAKQQIKDTKPRNKDAAVNKTFYSKFVGR
jgi:pseudouridine synthase